ncbi:MAG: endonuclease/exonuclease/phosphatase family protein [Planctomycetota bacterium]|jgi:endonuclease/exonuclease/phosphatase family metal-dependent hydrolase
MKILKKSLRLTLIVFGALLAFILAWYLINRITAPGRRIKVIKLDSVNAMPGMGDFPAMLRIMTYNIAHGRGCTDSNWQGCGKTDRAVRLDDIVRLIRESNPDVVVLNEVDFSCTWSGGVNQARHIARCVGFRYLVEEINHDFWIPFLKLRFGNAILSRHSLENENMIDLPAYSRLEELLIGKKRGVSVSIKLNQGEDWTIIALHLEHRSEKTRCKSIDIVSEHLSGMKAGTRSLVIAGDLNSTFPGFPHAEGSSPEDNAIARLESAGGLKFRPEKACSDTDFTYPADTPRMIIDWIIAPASHVFKTYRPIKAELSDHLPVFAEIHRLEKTKEGE